MCQSVELSRPLQHLSNSLEKRPNHLKDTAEINNIHLLILSLIGLLLHCLSQFNNIFLLQLKHIGTIFLQVQNVDDLFAIICLLDSFPLYCKSLVAQIVILTSHHY